MADNTRDSTREVLIKTCLAIQKRSEDISNQQETSISRIFATCSDLMRLQLSIVEAPRKHIGITSTSVYTAIVSSLFPVLLPSCQLHAKQGLRSIERHGIHSQVVQNGLNGQRFRCPPDDGVVVSILVTHNLSVCSSRRGCWQPSLAKYLAVCQVDNGNDPSNHPAISPGDWADALSPLAVTTRPHACAVGTNGAEGDPVTTLRPRQAALRRRILHHDDNQRSTEVKGCLEV